ncbi:hypothetical protein VTL71DRAFT_5373 [Oculimacula yallundae]|uniref:Zn(2)-C6 fungal-type domain-containing protein n=1 Tax=Oculimacula yallundae TaxID=86028 RepID=A0ABR4C0V9_9HELO
MLSLLVPVHFIGKMFPQRYSCDRCRQQKSRCPKVWDIPTLASGAANYLTPCERCTKADVSCVYSLKQRSRRPKGENVSPTKENTGLGQDLSILSGSDVAGYNLDDMMTPSLDTTIACMDDAEVYCWNDNPDLTYHGDSDGWTQPSTGTGTSALGTNPTTLLFSSQDEGKEETLTEQLMRMSNWAIGATRELGRTSTPALLTVNSPVVSEAFAAANTLVRIINSILLASSTSTGTNIDGSSPQPSSSSSPPTDYSPIFLALASHQHILALFRVLCDSIKRSLGSISEEAMQMQMQPQEEQGLHAAIGSSSSSSAPAQFSMVLQLILHLLNRISRSLRMGESRRRSTSISTSTDPYDMMFGMESVGVEDRNSSPQSIIDSTQLMLRTLPDEHGRLREVVRELRDYIEEGVYVQI